MESRKANGRSTELGVKSLGRHIIQKYHDLVTQNIQRVPANKKPPCIRNRSQLSYKTMHKTIGCTRKSGFLFAGTRCTNKAKARQLTKYKTSFLHLNQFKDKIPNSKLEKQRDPPACSLVTDGLGVFPFKILGIKLRKANRRSLCICPQSLTPRKVKHY